MKALLLTLVTIVYVQVSIEVYAAQSIAREIKTKETIIESANSNLNNARKDVRYIEGKLKSNQENTDKTRKIVMQERQTLRRLLISTKRKMKKKSHAVKKIEKEIIRAKTRLKLETNKNEAILIKAEMTEITLRKQIAIQKLKWAEKDIERLEFDSEDSVIDSDPRIVSFIQEKHRLKPKLLASKNKLYKFKRKVKKLNNDVLILRKIAEQESQLGPIAKKEAPKAANAYVYAISGSDDPDIESSLQLKDWVESYGAVYIEGHWNNIYGGPLSDDEANIGQFAKQFEEDLKKIPSSSKLILIGHGLGGGAVITVATGIAATLNRKIDLLVALDPVGNGNLRANIVFETEKQPCQLPRGDRQSNDLYANCIKASKPRQITANVAHFYNRWQKDSQAPFDYYKELLLSNGEGKPMQGITSTGKFKIASDNTKANQKREFYEGSEDAHQMILSDAVSRLPNLLVDHVR